MHDCSFLVVSLVHMQTRLIHIYLYTKTADEDLHDEQTHINISICTNTQTGFRISKSQHFFHTCLHLNFRDGLASENDLLVSRVVGEGLASRRCSICLGAPQGLPLIFSSGEKTLAHD